MIPIIHGAKASVSFERKLVFNPTRIIQCHQCSLFFRISVIYAKKYKLKHLLTAMSRLFTNLPLGRVLKGLESSIPAYSRFALTCCISSRCCRTISSTTEGSASVDTSPNSSGLFWATFLKIRRIIFPDRVLGRSETT